MTQSSANSDKDQLIALLQAHGNNFLSSFGPSSQTPVQPNRKRRKLEQNAKEELEDDGVSWTGFGSEASISSENEDSDAEKSDGTSDDDEEDERYDDDFRSDKPLQRQPEVVVFSGTSQMERSKMSKLQAKSFMSSKISKLREEITESGTMNGADDEEGVYGDERTNLQNDKILHKLIHTQLLSGSFNSELSLTPAQRRKALDGRVLELAAGAKLGKGESIVRKEERKKAAKNVRMGLERKVEERRRKALEEAKDLGNYHHSIKHLFEDDSKEQSTRRKRDRGLKLGVGKFAGGVLKLSKDEIASVQDRGGSSRGGRRGGGKGSSRGGRRGGGKGSRGRYP